MKTLRSYLSRSTSSCSLGASLMKKIKQIFNKKSRTNEIGIFGFKQNFKDRSRINVQAIDISDFSSIYGD